MVTKYLTISFLSLLNRRKKEMQPFRSIWTWQYYTGKCLHSSKANCLSAARSHVPYTVPASYHAARWYEPLRQCQNMTTLQTTDWMERSITTTETTLSNRRLSSCCLQPALKQNLSPCCNKQTHTEKLEWHPFNILYCHVEDDHPYGDQSQVELVM